jgi:hypothetical protein
MTAALLWPDAASGGRAASEALFAIGERATSGTASMVRLAQVLDRHDRAQRFALLS